MVVVALIGILAAIGIPQYSKFQAKARQTEAKSSLSSLYTAEVSFFNEWNKYTISLKNVGFAAKGNNLRYITGFRPTIMGPGIGCPGYGVTLDETGGAPLENPPGEPTYSITPQWQRVSLTCGALMNLAGPNQATFKVAGAWGMTANICLAFSWPPSGTDSFCEASPGSQAFRAMSIGDPGEIMDFQSQDGWTIDHLKQVSNSSPGIK